ncbi:MAG: ABC transporter permease [Proteobacteria bacterium]|nr:ABC transporter permease [Pseudomonadota bacterium]MBU4295740.1 ABC transporter permease [Pseudomonadota bacterium]MCG2747159.1 ABC transporter permease [Desulfobulbaceae bacterium]
MQNFSISPVHMFLSLWRNRNLIRVLTVREVAGRYRGSVLGILWSFFNPVLMLAVYTFVFSVVFKARWPGGGESRAEFALVLFAGLLIFNLFSECLNRAPSLILGNASYVKKVVFPLELLPFVSFGAALFHALVSLMVWLLFYFVLFGVPHATFFMFPVLLAPLALLILGVTWFLAALSVYLRDTAQIIGVLTSVMMFITPIFYPISAIPERYQFVLSLNPLAFIVEQARNLLFFGKSLAWRPFFMLTVFTALTAWLGFFWFQKIRKGFADVI